MNGLHDLGGMHGLGPIEREANEPVFHADWERRVLALNFGLGGWRKHGLDGGRHAQERVAGAGYLDLSYYERWFRALVMSLTEAGRITPGELAAGRAAPGSARATPAFPAAEVGPATAAGSPTERKVANRPAFRAGQRVRARNMHPPGHTRLPRYARGKTGTIAAHHGAHVFPDTNAHAQGEQPHHLYSVRFEGATLWGPDAVARDAVYIDLWEPYLEPA